jgi:hypothetical protein
MTASAQLGNRPVAINGAAGGEHVLSRTTKQVRAVVLPCPLPAPPALAPPVAPVVRRLHVTSPAQRRVQTSAARGTEAMHPPALRSVRAGRLVVTVMVTMIVVGGLSWLGQTRDPGLPAHTAVVRVGAGETVWDVAARVAPQSDQGAVVERIRQLNGLVGSAVNPGQQLQVPAGR